MKVKQICKAIVLSAMLLGSVSVVTAQNVVEKVNTTSAADVLKRMPTNAAYVYDDFQPGVVYFKDGSRASATLNYCFLLDEMHFKNKNDEVEALAGPENVALVKIGDDAFFYGGKASFVQMVVYDDDVRLCYRRHTVLENYDGHIGAYGTGTETVAASRVQSIAFNPSVVDLNKVRDLKFTVKDDYVLLVNGKLLPIRSGKVFEKAFPKLKKEIKQYLADNKFNSKDPDDVVALMEYCIKHKK